MLETVRLYCGTSYARFHFRTAREPIIRFTDAVSQARRLIVFLPELPADASLVEGVMRFLVERYHTSKILLVVRKEVMNQLPEHRGFNILAYGAEEVNALYVPRTDLLRRVKKSTFDLALDLNVRFALPSSFLCRASQAPLRIGFVKPHADSFYNFQIQARSSNNLTQVYDQLLTSMEMF